MKHAILTTGQYSDYEIDGLIEYPDSLDLRAIWLEWERHNPKDEWCPDWQARDEAERGRGRKWIAHVLSMPGVKRLSAVALHDLGGISEVAE